MKTALLTLLSCAWFTTAVCLLIGVRRWSKVRAPDVHPTGRPTPGNARYAFDFVERRLLATLDAELPTWQSVCDKVQREREQQP
jgi:hypothetical protein